MTELGPDVAQVVGFLHTAEVHVVTFEALAGELLPSAVTVHRVDPDALELARQDGTAGSVRAVVAAHLEALRDEGCEVVLCTCSTLGGIAEAGADITVEVSAVEGVREAFLAGDAETYHASAAKAARALAARCDVVVLAQASMEPAMGRLVCLETPVLISPRSRRPSRRVRRPVPPSGPPRLVKPRFSGERLPFPRRLAARPQRSRR